MSGLATEFAARIRRRERAIGYWSAMDAPVATERIGRLGYDYVVLDAQHGLIGYSGILNGLTAIDAGAQAVGMVRVEDNHLTLTPIGRALDAGAAGVIVPLVNTPAEAASAVSATRYPPAGRRSYGPMRSGLRIGPRPSEADASTLVFAMIETREGLENVEAICRTPGLDGVYVGPSDLVLGLGGAFPGDPAVAGEFEAALRAVSEAAKAAGVASGIHTHDGEVAAKRLAEGFTFASVASDLVHLELAARAHLTAARGRTHQ
ncbi:HpcH/HpaI aldolase family protein [Actinopolymorpha singaporensis]|uniref:4-hydroxy-2-oxoheptanedioate aldolase n=1 Tax=Actinopolymorpha singaporensis TaxID=117157 RepID=A0A1H1V2E1_9ACTN|nr:aldolase/citrate lyase family protein [Actinopolymorpha singaporensis]SDS78978.1 4-hydroxy-2-oxoheptanedioate aldolase [Actinopolymorpha singaporensis]